MIDKTVGLKIEHDEELGLDEGEHDERAYEWRHSMVSDTIIEEQIHQIIQGSIDHHIEMIKKIITCTQYQKMRTSSRKKLYQYYQEFLYVF